MIFFIVSLVSFIAMMVLIGLVFTALNFCADAHMLAIPVIIGTCIILRRLYLETKR